MEVVDFAVVDNNPSVETTFESGSGTNAASTAHIGLANGSIPNPLPTGTAAAVALDLDLEIQGEDLEGSVNRFNRPITLEFEDVSFATGTPRKQILTNVSGFARPGHVIAIMGPSGAGKTTLLDTLAGRLLLSPANELTGSIKVNGEKRTFPGFQTSSAYVLQSDYFFPILTVRETITFSALLRLPQTMPREDKIKRVDQIIRELGLVKCQHTLVGNELVRGVSGGERKRVNIGTELVTDPSLIFLDEPTSGLDATSAESVMGTLLRLAKNDRTIITTIHQPRSSIFAMFDGLLLLSEGRCMYFGHAQDAEAYFARLGSACPHGFNPADYFLDQLSLDVRTSESEKTTRARIEMFAQHYASHLATLRKDEHLDKSTRTSLAFATDKRPSKASSLGAGQYGHDKEKSTETLSIANAPKYATSFLVQLRELSVRSFRNILRSKETNIATIMQNLVFALLLGFIWLRECGPSSGITVQSTAGLLFFAIVNQAFSGSFGVIFLFPAERAVVLKERASKSYRLSAYFWSKFVSDLPRLFLTNFIFMILVFFMTNLRQGGGYFFAYYIIVVMTQLASESLTYIVSAGSRDAQLAGAITPVFLVTSMLFSGFFIGTNRIPIWLRWLRYVSFIKYAFALAMQTEYEDRSLDLSTCTSTFCPTDGNSVLSFYGVDDLTYAANFLILMGLILALRLLAYYVLLRRGAKYDRSI